MKKTISILIILSTFISCSKMEESQKQNKNLAKDTRTVKEVSNKTKLTLDEINNREEIKSIQDIEINSAAIRLGDDMLSKIKNKKNRFDEKLTYAEKYLESFEFQYHSVETLGSQNAYDQTLLKGLNEFFGVMNKYTAYLSKRGLYFIPREKTMSPLNMGKRKHNKQEIYYAIAAKLNSIDTHKAIIAEKSAIEIASFESLFKKALLNETTGKRNSSALKAITQIRNRKTAVMLLNARMNILITIASYDFADINGIGILRRISNSLCKATNCVIGKVRTNEKFQEYPNEMKQYILSLLHDALEIKLFLEKIGEKPLIAKDLKSLISNIDQDEFSEEDTLNIVFLDYIDSLLI